MTNPDDRKLPPRMTVFKDEVSWGPGSDPLSFPETVEYCLIKERDRDVAEARAKAFEEAADSFEYCGETAVSLAYMDKARAARGEGKK